MRFLPRFAAVDCGLLWVTDFLVFSSAALVDDADPGALAGAVFFCMTGLAGADFLLATAGLADFTGLGGAAFLPVLGGTTFFGTAFFGATFFAGAFRAAALDVDFTAALFDFAERAGFFATAGFFAVAFESALRAFDAVARATGFGRAAALVAFARWAGLCLIFAIPEPIL